jgi:hypothetical protein
MLYICFQHKQKSGEQFMVETGFLLDKESFVWTQRGLLTTGELKPGDKLLGMEAGKPSWSAISSGGKKYNFDRLVRIITDGNEVSVSRACEVFTLSGIKKASDVVVGDILETFNIPNEIRMQMDSRGASVVESDAGPIKIDSKIAYVLGTQIKSPKFENKVVIRGLNPNHAYEVARLCSEALKEQFIRHKIYYLAGGKKVRIDCDVLVGICRMINEETVPRFIRESHATALRHFVCGILDTIVCISESEDPPTFFITLAKQSVVRRLILNVLRLWGVIPVKTYFFHPSYGLAYIRTYVNPQDLRQFGLRFIRSKDAPEPTISQKGKPISYCTVRDVVEFHGKTLYLPEPKLHWSPIVDIAPIHRHALP